MQTTPANRTLLVDGPASVRLVSGKAQVFGCPITQSQRVVVREGKRMPFYVTETASFEVSMGHNATTAESVSSTIPESWDKPLKAILAIKKRPVVVVVLGASDRGKTSLTTYLLNRLVDGKCKVAVLDGDLGQSDIGPSATVGYAVTSKPVAELFDLTLENAFFVGATSPTVAMAKAVEGFAVMQAEILRQQVDFVLVNTDGWVSGELAAKHKASLIETLKPDVVVGVQMQNELAQIVAGLPTVPLLVESSPALSQRPAEKRKALREMTYARYLKDAKIKCYNKHQMAIEPPGGLLKPLDPRQGILLGIYDYKNKFLGIGVLREVNMARRVLKVQTAVLGKPSKIVLGNVLINEKLQEI